jgi:hypothetical protein
MNYDMEWTEQANIRAYCLAVMGTVNESSSEDSKLLGCNAVLTLK